MILLVGQILKIHPWNHSLLHILPLRPHLHPHPHPHLRPHFRPRLLPLPAGRARSVFCCVSCFFVFVLFVLCFVFFCVLCFVFLCSCFVLTSVRGLVHLLGRQAHQAAAGAAGAELSPSSSLRKRSCTALDVPPITVSGSWNRCAYYRQHTQESHGWLTQP